MKSLIKTTFRLFILFLCLGNIPAKGQILYEESFESIYAPGYTVTMPLGWRQYRITPGTYPDDYFNRLNSGINPVIPPHTGNKMLRFRSRNIPAGDTAILVSKVFDMGFMMPAGGANFGFWMYRDSGFPSNFDMIRVYVNTQPGLSGTPILLNETTTGSNFINRSCSLLPAPANCNGWNQYMYNIPNIAPFNSASVYILIVAISGGGNDIHIDDFFINTHPAPQTYIASSAEIFVQNTQLVNVNSNNQVIIGCKMTMDGALTPKVLTQMQFNTLGSTNPPIDISNAKLWFSGGTDYFNPDNAILLGTYNNLWLTNYTFLTLPNVNYSGMSYFNGLDHGDNYFWITYDIAPGAVMGNFIDAEWVDFAIPTLITPNPVTLPGYRKIENYTNGYFTIGTSWNDYNNNDFINHVTLVGNNIPVGGINNSFNSITQACGTNAASGCSNGPFPKDCPFQHHPFDYEMFPEVAGKTTELTANDTTNYLISVQCGTYSIGNSVAAWIDYNQDGTFNNWFYNITLNCTGAAGNDTIYINNQGAHPGWRVGMNVAGSGIALGATIVTAGVDGNGAYVVLSVSNTGVVSGNVIFTDLEGEKVLQSQLLGSLGTFVTTFRVPSSALPGKTRMRVRENWTNYNISPTAWYTYGEIEDYVVNMIGSGCQPYPNYTTWLGYTDQWQDPNNWCPPIAPLVANQLMNVRIPGGPSGPYTYYRPVIGSGVNALAAKLRVEAADTIHIQNASQSSLTVNDSLKIQDAPSAIIINPYIDSVQVSTGTINIPQNSPLSNHDRSRSFILIPQSELMAQGMQTGDVICKILIHIQRNSNGYPYRNFTVTYYHVNNPNGISGTGYTAVIPNPIGVPVVIWSGDLDPTAFVPTVNGYGTIELTLQTPVTYTGQANPICVEICYDNTGFPTTGSNDEPRFTSTGTTNWYLGIQAVTNYVNPGCSMMPSDVINVTATWNAGSNTMTVLPSQVGNVLLGMISYPDGNSVVSIVGTTITMNSAFTTNGTSQNMVLSNVRVITDINRPNLTFIIGCDSMYKFPMYVRGHWENNGTFTAGLSRVYFDGTLINQKIDGQSQTTFYDAEIDNPNHVIRMTDFSVMDSLHLEEGRLKLNLGMVTLHNPQPWALTRTAGFIQSETDLIQDNVTPFGRLYWKMGTIPGQRIIPYCNTNGVHIPFTYGVVSGTHDVVLGTYGTFPDNTNLPLPEVTNVTAWNGTAYTNTGETAADRFYLIHDSLGINPYAQVIFTYALSERAALNGTGAVIMRAQRWLNANDLWEFPFIAPQVYTSGPPDWVLVNSIADSVFSTSDWWIIALLSNPLGTSLEELSVGNLTAHPNPVLAGETLSFQFKENNFQPEMISIYSTDGREVYQEKIEHNNTSVQIPLSIQPGIYYLFVRNSENSAVMKLMILER